MAEKFNKRIYEVLHVTTEVTPAELNSGYIEVAKVGFISDQGLIAALWTRGLFVALTLTVKHKFSERHVSGVVPSLANSLIKESQHMIKSKLNQDSDYLWKLSHQISH